MLSRCGVCRGGLIDDALESELVSGIAMVCATLLSYSSLLVRTACWNIENECVTVWGMFECADTMCLVSLVLVINAIYTNANLYRK